MAPHGSKLLDNDSAPPSVQRSARLAGEPAGSGLSLSRQKFLTPEGIEVDSLVVYDGDTDEWKGDWAYRVNKNTRKKAFFPGQIIMAIDSHPNTVLEDSPLTSEDIEQTACAPIFAKMRAMIVIHLTYNGLLCLPMYTYKDQTMPHARCQEVASITNNSKWSGVTPWAGFPLRMKVSGPGQSGPRNAFIELLQPVHVLPASRIIPIGYMTGGEYARLMRLLTYTETHTRAEAFWVYKEAYVPDWKWKPTPGPYWKKYSLFKNRMDKKTDMRW